jgi:hypothetical protein
MPGLIRGVARTAVIAGTASATAGAVNRRQAKKNVAAYEDASQAYAQQQPAAAQPQPAVAPAPAPMSAEPDMDDKISQLERLAQLKAQGILTDEEFAQQKMKILG